MKHLFPILSLLAALLIVGISPANEIPDDDTVAAHVAAFEGVWAGEDNLTPFGNLDMAFSFVREDDGSLHARSAQSAQTWIDIRFHEEVDGWKFTEAGSMEGLGVQRYTMKLVGLEDERFVWEVPGREDFMTVFTQVDESQMLMEVSLRGEPHVRFELQKLGGEAAEQLAGALAEQAEASYFAEESK